MAAKPCKLQQVTQTRRGGGSARGSCQTPKTQAHTVVGLRRAQMPVTTRFSTTPRTCRCRYTVDTGAGTPAGAGTPWTPHLQVQVHRGHRGHRTCRCRYTVDTGAGTPAGAGTPWTPHLQVQVHRGHELQHPRLWGTQLQHRSRPDQADTTGRWCRPEQRCRRLQRITTIRAAQHSQA